MARTTTRRLFTTKEWTNLEEVRMHLSDPIALDGDFDANQYVTAVKIGNVVTITSHGILTHSSMHNPGSVAAVLPADFRPSHDLHNLYSFHGDGVSRLEVDSSGRIGLYHLTWAGASWARADSICAFSVSYAIT